MKIVVMEIVKYLRENMRIKKLTLTLLILIGVAVNAQKKYVIVPHKFPFSMRNNQYGMNKSVKEFFDNEGFVTFYNDELPVDIENNKCMAYYVSVRKKSKQKKRSVWVDVKNCNDSLIVTSVEGKSRLLEASRSSNEALNKALQSLKNKLIVKKSNAKSFNMNRGAVANLDFKDTSLYALEYLDSKRILFSNSNGDMIKCVKTSLENVYIAQKNKRNGLVYKKKKFWVFEYVLEDIVKIEKIKTKSY